ncbi:MAG TPA: hypothetical protein DCR35_08295, partial [Runella sp.]|nr:hypothetical protein [Runella sp.]
DLVWQTYPNLLGFLNVQVQNLGGFTTNSACKPHRFSQRPSNKPRRFRHKHLLANLIGFDEIAQMQDFFFSEMQHLLNQICHYYEITANWNLNYT